MEQRAFTERSVYGRQLPAASPFHCPRRKVATFLTNFSVISRFIFLTYQFHGIGEEIAEHG